MDEQEFHYDPKDFPDPHLYEEYDPSQLLHLLRLTPLQRLQNNEGWREFMLKYRGAAGRLYGNDPRSSQTSA